MTEIKKQFRNPTSEELPSFLNADLEPSVSISPTEAHVAKQAIFDAIETAIGSLFPNERLGNSSILFEKPLDEVIKDFGIEPLSNDKKTIFIQPMIQALRQNLSAYVGVLRKQMSYFRDHPDLESDDYNRGSIHVELEQKRTILRRLNQYESSLRELMKRNFYKEVYEGHQVNVDDVTWMADLSDMPPAKSQQELSSRVQELRRDIDSKVFEQEISPRVEEATLNQYIDFWKGYYLHGGEHYLSFYYVRGDHIIMGDMKVGIAKKDFRLYPSEANIFQYIIVPSNVKFLGGKLGDRQRLLFVEDFTIMYNKDGLQKRDRDSKIAITESMTEGVAKKLEKQKAKIESKKHGPKDKYEDDYA